MILQPKPIIDSTLKQLHSKAQMAMNAQMLSYVFYVNQLVIKMFFIRQGI